MNVGGAAEATTLGAAGVEVAQIILAETQSAVLPLVPYLDTLRWVFIVVALMGVAVTIYARLDDWEGSGDDLATQLWDFEIQACGTVMGLVGTPCIHVLKVPIPAVRIATS